MNNWQDIKRMARDRRAQALVVTQGNPSAAALLDAAQELTKIPRVPVTAGDPLLDGGEAVFEPEAGVIYYNADLPIEDIVFHQAHEYAHVWREDGPTCCTTADLDAEADEEPIPLGVHRIEGYSPEALQERGANVFAREFLLAVDDLRRWFANEGLDAQTIAARVGVWEGMVLHQLTAALLLPEPSDEATLDAHPAPDHDQSQDDAAQVEQCPLLVEAGPGTGKTRTLVKRVAILLKQNVQPESILALTYSNRAAEEMRLRVAATAPQEAHRIWMGTFHAFGLELLRKFGTHIGIPAHFSVIDPVDALLLLEQHLIGLQLDHYQNLYEPTTFLRHILAAISRAKDELVSPAEYTQLGQQMRQQAATTDEIETAEKVLEVARVYTFYQEYLERASLLDFGDLIFRSVTMLRADPDLRDQLRQVYTHILVDEYQDVNRASGLLLHEIAGAGQGLWVVGDARQAIYRFRGAAPINMQLFEHDFPGARVIALNRNYRSQPAVVDAFAAFAPHMSAGGAATFTPWQPHRPDEGGHVHMHIADDLAAESAGIARTIQEQHAAGLRYGDQAVLCRSHTTLARIAILLEQAGVPVLYLGDLFERAEVRDLLALISLACEAHGSGLVRVAKFPEYAIPFTDTRRLLALAREQQVPFPRALQLAEDDEQISQAGKEGLSRLVRHLDGICYGTSAWSFLSHYLFNRSSHLRMLISDTTLLGQQRRLALYQLLQFAHEQRAVPAQSGIDPKQVFLRYVRRLEMFGEEKQLRELPDGASNLDAVRLLTVHASKGLEFKVVYVPALGAGYFPAKRQWQPCPPPPGMISMVEPYVYDEERQHAEEEECLFFVALSRARDALYLSRARRYGSRTSNASHLLTPIRNRLPHPPDGSVTWPATAVTIDVGSIALPPVASPPVFDVAALDLYIKCGLRYFYEHVLGLSDWSDDSAYVQFHRCVYQVLRWLHQERAQDNNLDEAKALLCLADAWATHGPINHPYESLYRSSAERLIVRALDHLQQVRGEVIRPEWEVVLPNGRVQITPDQVEVHQDGSKRTVTVRRMRTGRASKAERERDIYALYQVGIRQFYPDAIQQLEIFFLSADPESLPLLKPGPLKTRLDKYNEAIAGILQEDFPPRPNDRDCPRCPHYFICPIAQDS